MARFCGDINRFRFPHWALRIHLDMEFLAIRKAAIVMHPCEQMNSRRASCIILIDVTFPVRDHRDAGSLGQDPGRRISIRDPAERFLVFEAPACMRADFAASPVPYLASSKAQNFAAASIHRQNRMQRQATDCATFADRPQSLSSPLCPAQHQVVAVLNGHNLMARSQHTGPFASRGKNPSRRHRRMPQKPCKTHLP